MPITKFKKIYPKKREQNCKTHLGKSMNKCNRGHNQKINRTKDLVIQLTYVEREKMGMKKRDFELNWTDLLMCEYETEKEENRGKNPKGSILFLLSFCHLFGGIFFSWRQPSLFIQWNRPWSWLLLSATKLSNTLKIQFNTLISFYIYIYFYR